MDGMLRTVAYGDRRRKAENQHLHLRFSNARPLAVPAPLLEGRSPATTRRSNMNG